MNGWNHLVLWLNLDSYWSFSVVAKLATNFLNWLLVPKVWLPWCLKWSQLGWLSELFGDVYNILEDTSAPRTIKRNNRQDFRKQKFAEIHWILISVWLKILFKEKKNFVHMHRCICACEVYAKVSTFSKNILESWSWKNILLSNYILNEICMRQNCVFATTLKRSCEAWKKLIKDENLKAVF